MEEKKKKIFGKILSVYTVIGMLFILFSIVLILIPTAPYIIYRLNPSETDNEVEKITMDLGSYDEEDLTGDSNNTTEEIPIDESLPEENYVVIPSIGVYSPITEGSNYTNALENGTWIVPDFGTPEDNYLPIILAAHRFGYIYWDRETREQISFYNLNKTETGDTVQIIWNQRLYTYEIYKSEESTYISDYSADLILYTCKYFNSPQRIFRYANRVEE